MDMKTNEVQVKLDEKSGVLTLALGPNGKMSLSTEDKLDNTCLLYTSIIPLISPMPSPFES